MPVGVVVSLFGAFKAAAISVWILTRVDGGVSIQVLISGEKAFVALSSLAIFVPFEVFVEAGRRVGIIFVGRGS